MNPSSSKKSQIKFSQLQLLLVLVYVLVSLSKLKLYGGQYGFYSAVAKYVI